MENGAKTIFNGVVENVLDVNTFFEDCYFITQVTKYYK